MAKESLSFDRAVAYYDKTRGFPDGIGEKVGAFIAEAAKLSKDTQILEIGIGTGRIALPLAPHVGHITGMDISAGMMAILAQKRNTEPISLSLADAHSSPFANHSFDAVLITHVLHLVAEPLRVLQEIGRVLKKKGRFLHSHSKNDSAPAMQALYDAWNAAVETSDRDVQRWNKVEGNIAAAGWQKVESHVYSYPSQSRVGDWIENVEERRWSSTWNIEETLWRKGLEAIYGALEEHFAGDKDALTRTEGRFVLDIYEKVDAD